MAMSQLQPCFQLTETFAEAGAVWQLIRRQAMARFFLAALAIGAAAAIAMVPDAARAQDYPFCIKGGAYEGGVGDCSFSTYEQCRATASGRDSYCDANPFYSSPEKRVARPRKPYVHQ
jgi:Protein of unknown function (DUF3551)